MKKKILITTILGLLVILNSCKKGITESAESPNLLEMTWTSDTLLYPGALQTGMYSI